MKLIISILFITALSSGCSGSPDAKADSGVTILEMSSPSGARCFVFMQDGRAVGGNCL